MKKFLTALLALILALAMAFAMVACEETNKDPNNGGNTGDNTEQGGDNTGDNTGDNEEKLDPVPVKTLFEAILDKIDKAEGFSVTLDGTFTGTYTVGDADPVQASDSDFADQVQELEKKYATNIINTLDDIYGLFADFGVDGILSAMTVPADKDNTGYEFSLTIDTKMVNKVVSEVQGFFAPGEDGEGNPTPSPAEEMTLYEALAKVLPTTQPDGTDFPEETTERDKVVAWLSYIFTDTFTVGDLQDLVNKILAAKVSEKITLAKLLNVIGGIMGKDINTILSAMESTPVATLVDGLIGSQGFYSNLAMMLIYPIIGDNAIIDMSIAELYSFVQQMKINEKAYLPTIEELLAAEVNNANLTVTLKTDKEMKLTSFSADIAFSGSISIGKVSYSADTLTAKYEGVFGYEKISSGEETGTGSEAAAA